MTANEPFVPNTNLSMSHYYLQYLIIVLQSIIIKKRLFIKLHPVNKYRSGASIVQNHLMQDIVLKFITKNYEGRLKDNTKDNVRIKKLIFYFHFNEVYKIY